MADAVTALTHWRRASRETRHEHTKEIVKEALPEQARAALVRMAGELDESKARIERLERMISALAVEAMRADEC